MSSSRESVLIFKQGLRIGWADFEIFWTWQSWLGSWMLRTVSNAMIWVLLGRLLQDEQTVVYLLIGNAVLTGPASVCWTIAASTWDRFDGTYPLIVIAPGSLWTAVAGRSSIWVLNGIVTSLLVFVILGAAFDLSIPPRAWLLVPPLVVLICLSTFGYSLFIGGFVSRAPRLRIIFNFGGTNLLMALTGVSVPISFWPSGIELLSRCVPITHGLLAVRLVFASAPLVEIAGHALRELTVGLVWMVLSTLIVDRLANHGRRDGSIDYVG